MGLHVAQMTSQKGIRQCFDAVTINAAKVMHLKGHGLEVGCDASFVLLQARDQVEAIRLRANRLKVWKKGKLVAETAEVVARLWLAGWSSEVGFPSANPVCRAARQAALLPHGCAPATSAGYW